jgi:hypothetical protein
MLITMDLPDFRQEESRVNRLLVFKNSEGWHVRYPENHPEFATIEALFGTDTLPLPWTAQAPAAKVIAELQAKNPESDVVLADWAEVIA